MSRPIRLVIFDMDGTITRPYLDFPRIRAALGLPEPLLESLQALPPGPARDRAFGLLEGFEREAALASELSAGAAEVLEELPRRGIAVALVTRNSRASVATVLEKHRLRFSTTVAREDAPAKPRPEPLWMICSRLAVDPADALMVGDHALDVQAGRNARMRAALVVHGRPPADLDAIAPDHVLDSLADLLKLCRTA